MVRQYLSTYQNAVKTAFPCKISLKLGNWLLSHSQKTTFKTADVRHLEFLKCSYLVIWLSLSSKCAAVYQISPKSNGFCSDMVI